MAQIDQVVQVVGATLATVGDAQLLASIQQLQQEPTVLERETSGGQQLAMCLVSIAKYRAKLEGRLAGQWDAPFSQQAEGCQQIRQKRGFELHLRAASEERNLARCFAAAPTHRQLLLGRAVHVGAIQAADAVIAEAGAAANGLSARFVANHAQCQVMALPIVKITSIADVHWTDSLSGCDEMCSNIRSTSLSNAAVELNCSLEAVMADRASVL
jgi:hypothetical protein